MFKMMIGALLLLISFTTNSAVYTFDKMRCKGNFIEYGFSVDKVKELCGNPIFEKIDENPFRTFVYMTYSAGGASSRYFLLFRNDRLEVSGLRVYNSGEYVWQDPRIK